MPVYSYACSNCLETFSRPWKGKSEKTFCSQHCQRAYEKTRDRDEYTMFKPMLRGATKRASEKNREISIDLCDLKNQWEKQDGYCALSGEKLFFAETNFKQEHGGNTVSLDRKDSSVGYTPENIQMIHKIINKMKMELNQDVFIYWVRKIEQFTRHWVLDIVPRENYNEAVIDDDPNWTPF